MTLRRNTRAFSLALRSALAASLLAALALSGCTSEPCVGPSCDGPCSGDACATGGGDPTGSGGSAGATGGGGSGAHAGSSAGTNGTAGPCQSDATCAVEHGFACVQGECRHACRSHYDCADEGVCEALAGEAEHYCNLDTAPEDGTYRYCPNGDECASGSLCLGAGPGDSRAYCATACDGGDDDCAPGFFCDFIALENEEQVPYCVRRPFCAPCDTDADCMAVPGQICARDQSGEKICTKVCDPGVDSCTWGNASICGVWDSELGVPTCAHRFGACHGTGKSCEPCTRDSDCPTGFCHGSSYTGERWCVDQSVTCDCDGLDAQQNICEDGNGCPESPDGVEMMCFDDERFNGDPFGHHCFGASTQGGAGLGSPQSGCWKRP
ncbi:MAG TPA: hypothetical protein VGK73_10240 [Polyangiaceae bacterium]